jgi:hypothetical protein
MFKATLKLGQAITIPFTVYDGCDPVNITGMGVTLVMDGPGGHFERLGVEVDAAAGSGSFAIAPADYTTLTPGVYVFEIWAASSDVPLGSGEITVVSVPQLA